jgi:NAD(P)-dependent dehydrogenase (short-subunit alcohol dehydrogenase family)
MDGVLVTGGGRRIGAGIARHLGRTGWHVFVHYNRSRDEAEALAEGIRAAGGQATAIAADLSTEDGAETLVSRCEAVRPLALLINNASTFAFDTVATATFASLDANMRTNLYAPVLLSRHFYDAVKARGATGTIVNLLDNKVFALNPDYFSYTLSKVGLNGMTQMLAMAFAPHVRVCGIAPGITLVSGAQSQENFERAHGNNPLGKGCTVEQIVRGVDFILEAPSYNGQTLVIDGGQVLQRRPRDVAFLEADGE